MGEYLTYNGREFKAGVCESMTGLRAEHVEIVQQASHYNPDPTDRAFRESSLFRFPFPDEDGKKPGDYGQGDDYERTVNVPGVEFDYSLIRHYGLSMQSGDRGPRAYIPCPYSPVGKVLTGDAGVRFFNLPTGVNIAKQRVWQGRLVLVAECAACGAAFRFPEFSDAEPVVVAARAMADAYRRDASYAANRADMFRGDANRLRAHGDGAAGVSEDLALLEDRAEAEDNDHRAWTEKAAWWDEVADRIIAGYENPPAWVAALAPAPALVGAGQ